MADLLYNSDNVTIIIKNNNVTIIFDSDLNAKELLMDDKKILILSKENNGSLIDFSIKDSNIKPKYKSKQNVNKVTSEYFYNIPIEFWRPKHIVQYVKHKYKLIYNFIPLELNWSETGYISNPKDRSKCWAHGKHLIDKFEKLKISRKRLKDYIDWSFEKNDNLKPTMALLSCNNWIDTYYIANKTKRIKSGYTNTEIRVWNEMRKR